MKLKYIKGIKANLQIYTNKHSTSVLDGKYRSIYKGKSLNFETLRAYVTEDDVKDIDWKSSARSNNLLVKEYRAEKKHNLMLIIDTGEKMDGISRSSIRKLDIALYTIGTLGYLSVNNGDYISTIIEEKGSLNSYPFRYSIEGLEQILTNYDLFGAKPNKTSLAEKLRKLYHAIKKNMIIFIVTDEDGLEELDERLLKEISTVHDVMIITIPDAYIYDEDVYDVDNHHNLPRFVSLNKKIHEEEIRIRTEQRNNNIRKLKRNHIDSCDISDIESIPEKLIDLLERHKYGGSRRK